MASKKVFIVGVAVIAAAAIAYFGFLKTPEDNDVAGTIGAAERHDAETTNDADVVLGEQALAGLMQSEVFVKLTEDPDYRAVIADPDFAKLAADPRLAVVMANPDFGDLVSQYSQGVTPQQHSQKKEQLAAEFALLAANPRFMKLAQDPRFMKLAQDPRFMKLAARRNFSVAMGGQDVSKQILRSFNTRGFRSASGQEITITTGQEAPDTGGVTPQQNQ